MSDADQLIEIKKPALAGWVPKSKDGSKFKGDVIVPVWVRRVQKQGLSPATLETYLENGWPLQAIANDRGLDLGDVIQAMDRWLSAPVSGDDDLGLRAGQ